MDDYAHARPEFVPAEAGTSDPYWIAIAGDGSIGLDRSYWADHAATEWEPRPRTWLPDPAACARAIATTITAAIEAARGGQG